MTSSNTSFINGINFIYIGVTIAYFKNEYLNTIHQLIKNSNAVKSWFIVIRCFWYLNASLVSESKLIKLFFQNQYQHKKCENLHYNFQYFQNNFTYKNCWKIFNPSHLLKIDQLSETDFLQFRPWRVRKHRKYLHHKIQYTKFGFNWYLNKWLKSL